MFSSLPLWGAWIEIFAVCKAFQSILSLPLRGAWIEMQFYRRLCQDLKSLPLRGAWIEIDFHLLVTVPELVAPPAGSVD